MTKTKQQLTAELADLEQRIENLEALIWMISDAADMPTNKIGDNPYVSECRYSHALKNRLTLIRINAAVSNPDIGMRLLAEAMTQPLGYEPWYVTEQS